MIEREMEICRAELRNNYISQSDKLKIIKFFQIKKFSQEKCKT